MVIRAAPSGGLPTLRFVDCSGVDHVWDTVDWFADVIQTRCPQITCRRVCEATMEGRKCIAGALEELPRAADRSVADGKVAGAGSRSLARDAMEGAAGKPERLMKGGRMATVAWAGIDVPRQRTDRKVASLLVTMRADQAVCRLPEGCAETPHLPTFDSRRGGSGSAGTMGNDYRSRLMRFDALRTV